MPTQSPTRQALGVVDELAAEGDLTPASEPLDTLDAPLHRLVLPDGRTLYPPSLFGRALHDVACDLMDLDDPTLSRFIRLIGPPGTGKSQIARAIAYLLWRKRSKKIAKRHGVPFYGLIELQPGPSSDEFFFRYDYVPDQQDGSLIGSWRPRSSRRCATGGSSSSTRPTPRVTSRCCRSTRRSTGASPCTCRRPARPSSHSPASG